jgi:hypothetical protein
MDVLSDINSSSILVPELEKAASRRAYANFQYSWSKRTMLALVDSSHTTQRSLQRQLSLSENSSCTSCDLNSETSTDCTTPTSIGQMPEDLVFRRKQSIKRTYAFNELIDTERLYVTDLRVMVEVWYSSVCSHFRIYHTEKSTKAFSAVSYFSNLVLFLRFKMHPLRPTSMLCKNKPGYQRKTYE